MTITFDNPFTERKLIKLGSKDSAFSIYSGLAVYRRSFLEYMPDCPSEYAYLITDSFRRDWIRLGAYVPEEQYMWEKLKGYTK